MSDSILVSGDMVIFNPSFAAAVVVVLPSTITGTGMCQVGGKPVCVVGDEKTVIVPGCTYTAPPHVTPGVGMLKIQALGADQTAKKTRSGGKPVLLKGSTFTAVFQVNTPAQDPSPLVPKPDATPMYVGTGTFQTTNLMVKGT